MKCCLGHKLTCQLHILNKKLAHRKNLNGNFIEHSKYILKVQDKSKSQL